MDSFDETAQKEEDIMNTSNHQENRENIEREIRKLQAKLNRLGDSGAQGNKAQATRWQNLIYKLEAKLPTFN